MAAPKLNPATTKGQPVFVFKPIERGQHIAGLGLAVVRALAQARAAKVEAQHRPAEAPFRIVERLHGVIDNLVVQVAAASGMGMADQRGKRRIGAPSFSSASSRPAGPVSVMLRMRACPVPDAEDAAEEPSCTTLPCALSGHGTRSASQCHFELGCPRHFGLGGCGCGFIPLHFTLSRAHNAAGSEAAADAGMRLEVPVNAVPAVFWQHHDERSFRACPLTRSG